MKMEEVVKRYGFDLARQKKHKVYKHPDGRIFVLPSTPSDWRASKNALSDFAKVMGVSKKELLAEPERPRPMPELGTEENPILLQPPEPVNDNPTPPVLPEVEYSKKDLKQLKRWEKTYQLREERRARQKQRLEEVMQIGIKVRESPKGKELDNLDFFRVFAVILRKLGWRPVAHGMAIHLPPHLRHTEGAEEAQDNLFLIYQVGPFYLDMQEGKARTETQWEWIEGIRFEVVGPL